MESPAIVCCVVVHSQTPHELRDFAHEFAGQGVHSHLVIIDNSEGRADLSGLPDAELAWTGANIGWTGGQSMGMAIARERGAEVFVMLNTDIAFLRPDALEELGAAVGDGAADVVSPVILEGADGPIWFAGGSLSTIFWVTRHQRMGRRHEARPVQLSPTGYATGCCMALSARALAVLDGMDEDLFFYFDDAELSLRARRLGLRVALLEAPLVAHVDRGRTHGGIEAYYFARNPFLLFRRHGKPGIAGLAGLLLGQAAVLGLHLSRCRSPQARRMYVAGLRHGLRYLRFGAPVGASHSGAP